MRRYIYIVIGILVAIIVTIGIFWFISSRPAAPATTGTTGTLPPVGTQTGNSSGTGATGNSGGTGTDGGSLGTTGSAQGPVKSFGIISNTPVLNYFVDAQNNVIAISPDGTINQISAGQSSNVSNIAIDNVIESDFSFDGKKLLLSFGDPASPQTSIFDVASKAWTSLPQGFISPRWAPTDYRIAYLTSNATTMSLNVLDASTTKKTPTTLFTLNANGLSLSWFNKSQVFLFDKPTSYAVGSRWLFDLIQKTLTPVTFEHSGQESVWSGASSSSPAMGLMLSSGKGGLGGNLQLSDVNGGTPQNLKFLTLPSKCSFNVAVPPLSTSTANVGTSTANLSYLELYCAVPRDQNRLSFSHLPDDYDQFSFFTSDDFYRINLQTGAISTVWNDQSQSLDASDVKFFNNTVFFVNRYNNKLYGMILN